ncbi:CaiB/BaiF CoA transferase family protein [Streptoalloteichus tenebrarius]|uniref:CaiB/BaiF CoA transferase family protein n=1 Tax=Streptoalloteichus tenebrarius (strain ATCC 17920 / DSM 40477 / JCM 4838 / CBS 697.72 / NBRC 16177 / NCIMB 11028 / NRRL B-12390 / A12253. 1 / ISP 5477) TaxID=1933 RepID=UPI0035590256
MSSASAPTGAGAPARPLDGLRVIDMAGVIMGPYACQILGDLGADVIKIEPPTGDVMRRLHRRDADSTGALALNLNRNKRSVRLDLKTPEGRQAALDLVATADALITNMRPRALRKLGLTYEDLAETNPGLVYCNAQGFRSDSPAADYAAYDEVIQACTGMVDLMRRTTGKPYYVPTALADKVCGLTIAYSVLAALLGRQRTGKGQHVEVPMADTMFAFTLVEHIGGLAYEPPAGPVGFPRSLEPGHAAFPTRDGHACILPYSYRDADAFFAFVGHPEEMDRFTRENFQSKVGELYEVLALYTEQHTTAEWEAFCSEHSIPFAPVMDLDHAGEHAYWAKGGMLDVQQHPREGGYRVIGNPVRFSGETGGVRRHCPELGEDTESVLSEIGYSPERIAAVLDASTPPAS